MHRMKDAFELQQPREAGRGPAGGEALRWPPGGQWLPGVSSTAVTRTRQMGGKGRVQLTVGAGDATWAADGTHRETGHGGKERGGEKTRTERNPRGHVSPEKQADLTELGLSGGSEFHTEPK